MKNKDKKYVEMRFRKTNSELMETVKQWIFNDSNNDKNDSTFYFLTLSLTFYAYLKVLRNKSINIKHKIKIKN